MLLLFATAGGLTVSGIMANIYRLAVKKQDRKDWSYYVVMVVAGPSVLVENSTKSFRAKKCSRIAYCMAVALAGYWSFSLGLLTIQLGLWSHALNSAHGLLPH
jgi:hypothetical protein